MFGLFGPVDVWGAATTPGEELVGLLIVTPPETSPICVPTDDAACVTLGFVSELFGQNEYANAIRAMTADAIPAIQLAHSVFGLLFIVCEA